MIDSAYMTGNKGMDDKIAKALARDEHKNLGVVYDEMLWVTDNNNPNKYHVSRAEKRQTDNTTFASKDEKDDYIDLKYLEKAGEIFDLRLQVPVEIIPSFNRGKRLIKGIYYVADAMYRKKDGKVYIQDTKGFATKEYMLKKKLVMYYHPEFEFVESRRLDYSDL